MHATICLVPFNNPTSFHRIVKQLSESLKLYKDELIVIDNSTNLANRLLNRLICWFYSETMRIRYFEGEDKKSLSAATNRAASLARGHWFIYMCSNHSWIYDNNFVDYLCSEMEHHNADLGGTISVVCRRHVQGGVFIAKSTTLRRHSFRSEFYPMDFMDVDLSQMYEKLGKKIIHIPEMISMMGKIPACMHEEWQRTKDVKVCHSHFYTDMNWEETGRWNK